MIVKVKQNKKVIFSFLFRWANNKTCDNQRYTKSPIKTKGLFNFEKLPAAWGHYINLLNSASPAALVGIVGSIHLVLQSVNKEGKFLSSAPADTLCHWHHTNHVVLHVNPLHWELMTAHKIVGHFVYFRYRKISYRLYPGLHFVKTKSSGGLRDHISWYRPPLYNMLRYIIHPINDEFDKPFKIAFTLTGWTAYFATTATLWTCDGSTRTPGAAHRAAFTIVGFRRRTRATARATCHLYTERIV